MEARVTGLRDQLVHRLRAHGSGSVFSPNSQQRVGKDLTSAAVLVTDTMDLLTLLNQAVSCHSSWAPGNREWPRKAGPSPAQRANVWDPYMWVPCAEMPLALWNLLFGAASLGPGQMGVQASV